MLFPDFAEVLAAARAGDRAALDRLIAELYPKVRELVHASLATDLRRKRPWLTAMFSTGDVVQEVFCGVIRDLDGFHSVHDGAFVNYLATLVKNRLVDAVRFHQAMRRDVRRVGNPIDEDAMARGVDPLAAAELEDELRAYTRALATFPQHEQLLLRERLNGARTFKELADLLGFGSEDAARRAFHAAQARLLLRLGQLESRPSE
ncbi:MAG: sigma-70 family RNA polymerase sigma factor [Planctomycetota bacterium]